MQARRLAAHLVASRPRIGPVTHLFSSDLRRAADTARAIADAQIQGVSEAETLTACCRRGDGGPSSSSSNPLLPRLVAELRERDFGSAEGKPFRGGSVVSLAAAGAEPWDAMRERAERFVREHLEEVLARQLRAGEEGAVVVVAHGVILDVLLRVLLARFGPAELARLGEGRGGTRRAGQQLVAWSNTGYVEVAVEAVADAAPPEGLDVPKEAVVAPGDRGPRRPRISMTVVGVNVVLHLESLKRTRGGIGSAQFDKRQRTIESFFAPASKKPKRGGSADQS